VRHRELAFDHDVADPPAPARQPVRERERLQVPVALRCHRAGLPLVGVERDVGAGGQGEGQVQGDQADPAYGGPGLGHGEQRVVAAGPQAGGRPGGETAQPVGDQPFVLGPTVGRECTAALRSEKDRHRHGRRHRA
jgi:hypothetical protein